MLGVDLGVLFSLETPIPTETEKKPHGAKKSRFSSTRLIAPTIIGVVFYLRYYYYYYYSRFFFFPIVPKTLFITRFVFFFSFHTQNGGKQCHGY